MKFHGLRYPRTSGEAFKDASYAACIERPWPSLWKRILQHIREVMA
jgi:hypothetical protein